MDKAHKKLRVWQESMTLVKLAYELTESFPSAEKYGLTAQMRRAAISIPSNIAEGAARKGDRESIQFYTIARGSLSELDTQIELSTTLGFLNSSRYAQIASQVETVDSLLSGLIRFVRKK
jgi:four helix bundle protein